MSDDSGETIFTFKADTKPAEQSLDSFGKSLGAKVIVLNQGFELLSKTVTGISEAFSKAVDFAQMGEEITAIGIRFNTLASQAGVVPEKISAGIEKALDGTVDMEDALKAASGAVVSLGTNSERIPQIFELAKKVTMLYGGSVIEQFDKISLAIASGNTRSLKQIGLITDAEKAFEKYGAQVGRAKDNLSEAQKQQAVMNAVLESGDKKFKDITASITPLSTETKKLSVAFKEVGDSIALVVNSKLGPALTSLTASFTGAFNNVAKKIEEVFLGKAPAAVDAIARIKAQIQDINNLQIFDPAMYEQRKGELDQLNQQLLIQQQIANQQATKEANDQQEISTTNAKGEAFKKTNEQRREELEYLRSAQEEWQNIQNAQANFENFKTGFQAGVKDMAKSVMDLGKQMSSTFVNGLSNSFGAVGKALAKGENVLDAFASSMLGVLGDLALQLSAFFIAQGIALLFSVGGAPQGAALIAAGAALGVLGGALKAVSGGGGGGGVPGSSPTSPSYTSETNVGTSFTQEQDRAKPETGVQVIVQGNVFDSRETGLQIAQILNDSFDLNGTIVRGFA